MPLSPQIPNELRIGPFTLDEARRHGITRAQLVGPTWRRVGVGLHVWSEIADLPMVRLKAAMRRLPDGAVFSGHTASWLHGLDATLRNPIEVSVPKTNEIWQRTGLALRRCSIAASEISNRRGFPVTSAIRTVADLGRRLPLINAVAIIDTATHRHLVNAEHLRVWIETHPKYRGIRHLRTAADLAEPAAESVMETKLRLLLVQAGLPRPKVQVTLRDDAGGFIARPDLYYPGARLAIEYDGTTHRESLVSDNRRQNRLVDAQYRILRFTAGDVLDAPAVVVSIVRRALAAPAQPNAGRRRST